ncbi:MAG TPA: DNA polymerase III subunit delta, partial [Ktedonobacteraceae bacterium]|nr:DNA polymerase III subunit delta [Ktedonobacteraceae bacterium]
MFYLLHGNDEFTCREHLKKLSQQGNFEFNQEMYISGEVDLATITATCNTLPFLSDQRLVTLVGLPKRRRGEDSGESNQTPETSGKPKKGKKGSKNRAETRAGFERSLAEYIPQLPETTVLIVLADEELPSSSQLLKAAEEHGKVIQCTLPKGAAVENWINKRATSLGVKVTPDATSMLANFIGNQLRLLANELEKLATYVGPGATITVEVV